MQYSDTVTFFIACLCYISIIFLLSMGFTWKAGTSQEIGKCHGGQGGVETVIILAYDERIVGFKGWTKWPLGILEVIVLKLKLLGICTLIYPGVSQGEIHVIMLYHTFYYLHLCSL